jgi:opacity protein-like surface antigen
MNIKLLGALALTSMASGHAFAGSKDMKEMEANVAPVPSEAGWYAGVFGGAIFDQDYYGKSTTISTAASPSITTTPSIRDGVGGGGGLKFGYNFDVVDLHFLKLQPAVEVEAFYMDPRIWSDSNFDYTPPAPPGPPPVFAIADPAYAVRMSGDLDTAAFFANSILRVKTGSIITPYFGFGVGVEYLRLRNVDISVSANGTPFSGNTGLHDDDFCLGLQGLAGFDVAVAAHWSIFAEYKYLVAVDPSFTFNNYDGAGSTYNLKSDFLGQDTITAGLKYNF